MSNWDKLWTCVDVVTCDGDLTTIKNGAVAVKDGVIAFVGSMQSLPGDPETLADQVFDFPGYQLTPGLIDCHTHIVYAGNRAHEFEQRLNGISYEEITRQGGGIKSTVSATRQASEDELFEQSLPRAIALQNSGVTTIEIKSGYGLDWETEKKMLRVAERIETALPITVEKTFLGAHTTPIEYSGNPQEYIDMICTEMLPQVAELQLADSVDVFCENIAFDVEQTKQVFTTAKKFNLNIKCHGEQLTNTDSAILAANCGALSVDHMEYASEAGVKAMAAAGTVAVLLPGAYYFLRESQCPPIDLMREHGVAMAVASDCNPGTSPILSLTAIMNMACTLFRMTPAEVMQGVTLNAAKALGLQDQIGSISVGKQADLAVWDVKQPAELMYYMGGQPLVHLVKAGKLIKS